MAAAGEQGERDHEAGQQRRRAVARAGGQAELDERAEHEHGDERHVEPEGVRPSRFGSGTGSGSGALGTWAALVLEAAAPGGGRRHRLVAAQDPEHAPHVGERLARRRGDRGERLAGAVRVAADQPVELSGLAHDRAEPARDRGLQVGRDPHPLLVGRLPRVPLAVALEPVRALAVLVLEQRLPARPAADEQRQRGGDQRHRRVGEVAGVRVEPDPRADDRDHGRRGDGERARRADVPPGRVQRDHERDERRRPGGRSSARRTRPAAAARPRTPATAAAARCGATPAAGSRPAAAARSRARCRRPAAAAPPARRPPAARRRGGRHVGTRRAP